MGNLINPSRFHAYVSEVVADSPLVYLRMNDASGTTVVDVSGNGHDFTLAGSPLPTLNALSLLLSDPDASIEFPGSSDARVTATVAAWMQPGAMTFEAWVNPDVITGAQALSGRRVGGASNSTTQSWGLLQNTNTLQYTVHTSSGVPADAISAEDIITAGTTYYIAATFDGTTVNLYMNALLVDTVARAGTLNAGTRDFVIGRNVVTDDRRFDGRIDEAAFYDHALTPARITAHYAAGRGTDVNLTVLMGSQASAGQGGSTSLSAVPAAASIVAGDKLLTFVGSKPYTVTPTTASGGWSQLNTGTNGTVASGAGTGSVVLSTFQKDAVGSDTAPAFTLTGGNTAVGKMNAFRKAANATWSIVSTMGGDSDATGTTLSITGAATLDITAGDVVAWCIMFPTNAPNTSARVVSIPGCTGVTTVLTNPPTVTTGDDCALLLGYFTVASGTASGPPTITATTTTALSSGEAVFVRLRAV